VQRWRGLESASTGSGRSVVTIGFFDGVHRGHQQIIRTAVERGRRAGQPTVLLTFDPHPSEVVRPGTHPKLLSTPRHKAALIEQLGVDVLCVVPFTPAFSRRSPEQFVQSVLVDALRASAVVVGENFTYGAKAAGTLSRLRATGAELGAQGGFDVEGVPLLRDDGLTLSSTFVRRCVADGDLGAAARVLGRPHRVEGVVVRGDARGRTIGYPTANVELTAYAAVPADGVYAGWLVRGDERLPAAISIGTNPTFAGRERRVEAYVLDFAGDLYGEHVALDVAEQLRRTETFASVQALVEQMRHDVERTRRVVSGQALGQPLGQPVPATG